jgi:hypothetical protein
VIVPLGLRCCSTRSRSEVAQNPAVFEMTSQARNSSNERTDASPGRNPLAQTMARHNQNSLLARAASVTWMNAARFKDQHQSGAIVPGFRCAQSGYRVRRRS